MRKKGLKWIDYCLENCWEKRNGLKWDAEVEILLGVPTRSRSLSTSLGFSEPPFPTCKQ